MQVIYPEDTRKEVPQVITETVLEDGTIFQPGGGQTSTDSFSIEFTPVYSTGVKVSDEDSEKLSMLF